MGSCSHLGWRTRRCHPGTRRCAPCASGKDAAGYGQDDPTPWSLPCPLLQPPSVTCHQPFAPRDALGKPHVSSPVLLHIPTALTLPSSPRGRGCRACTAADAANFPPAAAKFLPAPVSGARTRCPQPQTTLSAHDTRPYYSLNVFSGCGPRVRATCGSFPPRSLLVNGARSHPGASPSSIPGSAAGTAGSYFICQVRQQRLG